MLRILFLTLLLISSQLKGNETSQQYKYKLSLMAIFNDDARFLKEWIEYHLLLGVEHFYLYNHKSTDNYKAVLEPYIERGIVELKDWKSTPRNYMEWRKTQMQAYKDGLTKASSETDWLAVIDTDEFIFPVEEETIPEFLKNYENFGGVVINWQQYGDSNVWEIPTDKLMIETLTWKADPDFEDHYQFKMILKPRCVKHSVSAHCFIFKFPWYAVSPDFTPYPLIQNSDSYITQIHLKKIRINHYWTRDKRFFLEGKIARMKKIYKDIERTYHRAEQMNAVEDRCMDKYVAPLRKQMGFEN